MPYTTAPVVGNVSVVTAESVKTVHLVPKEYDWSAQCVMVYKPRID